MASCDFIWQGLKSRVPNFTAYVLWDPQLAAYLMPSGSVKEQDGVTAGRHLAADLLEMQVHRFGIGIRQDQSRADIATRTEAQIRFRRR